MNVRQLLAVATAATLLVPGTALAGKGNGKPSGKPEFNKSTVSIRTLEGPATSPDVAPVPTAEAPAVVETPEVVAAPVKKAKKNDAKKAAKRACKGLSKKKVKGKKGTPYSRCIVAAAQRRKQPVVEAPVEPAPVESAPITETPAEQPTAPVIEEPAPVQPTDPAL